MTSQVVPVDPPRARTGLVRVGAGLLVGTVSWSMPFSAAMAVLLPQRIASISEDHKVGLLAVLTGLVAVVGLVAGVVFGVLSDRTRSRWGSRTPWMVGGAVASSAFVLVLSTTEGYAPLLVWWSLAIFALNAVGASLAAVLPDRVPVSKRATLSAMQGLGILVGNAVGAVIGAVFIDDVATGLRVATVGALLLSVLTVVLAPDHPSPDVLVQPAPSTVRDAFAPPRNAPDFYWALWGRLFLVLGYFMINAYQLYILTDYVELSDDRAAKVLGLNSIVFLLAALVSTSVAGPASDRLQRRKVFVAGASVLAAVAISVPLFSASIAAMTVFSVVGGLAFGAYYSVDAALLSEVLPDEQARARDLGILNIANTGGQVLAPAASSLLLGLGIGFMPVFVCAILICVVGAVLIVPIRSAR